MLFYSFEVSYILLKYYYYYYSSQNHFNKKSINLNYSHAFDSSGKTFTMDLDYIRYDGNTQQDFLNNTFLPDGSLKNNQQTRDTLPSLINIYSFKADFSAPQDGPGNRGE